MKFYWSIFLGALGVAAQAVETVTVRVGAEALGLTLSHEHVLVDFVGADAVSRNRYDADEVIARAMPHVMAAKARGVRTIVECTPNFIGRDPMLLRRLSELSGVQILTNTGLYGAAEDKFLPEYAWQESVEQLAARWIAEAEDGIEGTGIKPAFVKLGVDRAAVLSAVDAKLIAAGALTHRATGLVLAVHTGGGPGLAQLDILAEYGVPAAAWIWVHAQGAEVADLLSAARRGAWISLDGLREKSVARHVELALALRAAGYWSQVLVSHDAGWFDPGKPQGGTFRDYEILFTHFLPELREAGVTESEIERLLAGNPAQAFKMEVRLLEGVAARGSASVHYAPQVDVGPSSLSCAFDPFSAPPFDPFQRPPFSASRLGSFSGVDMVWVSQYSSLDSPRPKTLSAGSCCPNSPHFTFYECSAPFSPQISS